jgi:putative endonuclease
MYYVYVLENLGNSDLYKGFTNNIGKRIKEYNSGMVESTRTNRPWKLVYCEVFVDKQDAISREKYLKSGWGRKFLKEVLENYFRNKQVTHQ